MTFSHHYKPCTFSAGWLIIIDEINHRYYYNIPDEDRRSKLIDIYKSNIIVEYIETVINDSFPNLNKKLKLVK